MNDNGIVVTTTVEFAEDETNTEVKEDKKRKGSLTFDEAKGYTAQSLFDAIMKYREDYSEVGWTRYLEASEMLLKYLE